MKTAMDIPDKEGQKRLVIVGGGFGGYISDYMFLVKRYLFGEIDQRVTELNEFLIVLNT